MDHGAGLTLALDSSPVSLQSSVFGLRSTVPSSRDDRDGDGDRF